MSSLPPLADKTVCVTFDGGRLTSDAGVLLLAEIERRLGIAERALAVGSFGPLEHSATVRGRLRRSR
jgi:hypothetical protein